MTHKAKQEVIKTLLAKFGDEKGAQGSLVNEIIHVIENIPDEGQMKPCIAPDYEMLYYETEDKLRNLEMIRDGLTDELRTLQSVNTYLQGFKEGVETVCGKDRVCHGHG